MDDHRPSKAYREWIANHAPHPTDAGARLDQGLSRPGQEHSDPDAYGGLCHANGSTYHGEEPEGSSFGYNGYDYHPHPPAALLPSAHWNSAGGGSDGDTEVSLADAAVMAGVGVMGWPLVGKVKFAADWCGACPSWVARGFVSASAIALVLMMWR